jgi:hypothetical protein
MRKMPRFGAPRMPRTGIPHARSLTNKVPHAATSKLGKSSAVSRKPPLTTGSLKKPTTGTNQLSTPTRQLTSQPKALTTAAKPSSAPKADQWGWSDCHSKGGVWGANGSCGHPTFTGTGGGGSGVQGHRPRLAAIPWFVPIVPHAFVDPLPCPAGFEKVGETFYGGTKCAPTGAARARGSYHADDPSPPPPPPPLADNDCMKARAGTAFFGIPGNPDPAAVREACESDKREAVAANSDTLLPPRIPGAPPPGYSSPPLRQVAVVPTPLEQPKCGFSDPTVDVFCRLYAIAHERRLCRADPNCSPEQADELRNIQYETWGEASHYISWLNFSKGGELMLNAPNMGTIKVWGEGGAIPVGGGKMLPIGINTWPITGANAYIVEKYLGLQRGSTPAGGLGRTELGRWKAFARDPFGSHNPYPW